MCVGRSFGCSFVRCLFVCLWLVLRLLIEYCWFVIGLFLVSRLFLDIVFAYVFVLCVVNVHFVRCLLSVYLSFSDCLIICCAPSVWCLFVDCLSIVFVCR